MPYPYRDQTTRPVYRRLGTRRIAPKSEGAPLYRQVGRSALTALLWLLIWGGGPAQAQQAAAPTGERGLATDRVTLDPAKSLTQYQHQAWTTLDGLPQNSIFAIEQTPDGYLWVGTQEGLARFDGLHFEVYDRADYPALSANNINRMLTDRVGTLWLAIRGGGLVSVREGAFTAYTTEHGLGSDFATALAEDQAGGLWVGTFEGGASRLLDGTVTTYGPEAGLSARFVSHIVEDQRGQVWVGTDEGLFVQRGDRFEPAPDPVLAEAYISALFEDTSGALWIGTRDGRLFSLAGSQRTAHSLPLSAPGSYVKMLIEDTEGTLWLGAIGGLFRYRAGRFDAFTMDDGLTNNAVFALREDREGGLWIGTQDGLNRLQDAKFTTLTPAEGLPHDMALSIYEGAEGALWIATQGGLARYQDGTMRTFTTEDGLPSDVVLSVQGAAGGGVWVGTSSAGAALLRNGRVQTFTTEEGLAGNTVFSIYTAPDGKTWFATDEGVNTFDGTTFEALPNEVLGTPFATAFLERADGSMWIGTYDAGLTRFAEGEPTTYTTEHGLPSDAVLALHEDEAGTLWIGTMEGGLARYRDDGFDVFNTGDGLPSNSVMALLSTEEALWLSSNRGVTRVTKASLQAHALNPNEPLDLVTYGLADGLRSVEANGGQQPAAWAARDGTFWFPTTTGVAGIHPEHIRLNTMPPPVSIKSLHVDNQPVALSGELVLPPGSDRLDFRYTALSLVAPETTRFRYLLEGYDDSWYEADTRRDAFYTNLGPGTYTLLVQASNNDGVWSLEAASLTFEIEPFFWQTRWFLVLCIFLASALAFAGYSFRVAQLKARQRHLERVVDERTRDLREEKEKVEQAKTVIEAQADQLQELDRFKTRFFANISHEFRTPLTLMLGPLDTLLGGAYGTLSAPVSSQLSIMQRNALRLLRLINQLLDLSRLESGRMELRARPRNVVQLVEGIVLSFHAFTEQKGIKLALEAEREQVDLCYESDKLEKVVFNLLSNAVKFTPADGRITVAITEQPATDDAPDGWVHISVADTGRGIPADKLPLIFDRFRQVEDSDAREHEGSGIGLSMVHELVKLHRGEVDVASTVGEGTVFTVRLKKGTAHLEQAEVLTGLGEEASAAPARTESAAHGEDAAGPLTGALLELASGHLEAKPEEGKVGQASWQPMTPPDAPLVLIVDDNADIRTYVASCLAGRYNTVEAFDGIDGLEKAHTQRPDIIISDIMMPRLDGNGLVKKLKQDPALRHIPVILLSAKTSQETIIEGLEHGADEYLAKPFNARELLVRLRNLMTLREQERELKEFTEHLEERVQEQVQVILRERRAHMERLLAEKSRTEKALQFRTNLMNNMSHEFRTPLTSVIGYAEILEMETTDHLREFSTIILHDSKRLLRTLSALIELAKVESTDTYDSGVVIALNREIERTVEPYRAILQERGLALRVNVPAQPVWVLGEPNAVHYILDALLNNACKFTETGGIAVSVKPEGNEAVVRVQDTGIGISEAFRPRLFEAFQQESDGLARSYEGIGLSLTLAQRYLELMQGSIEVESKRGRGSVFTVRLPLTSWPLGVESAEGRTGETAARVETSRQL